MKRTFTIALPFLMLAASCNSPVKKQHADRQNKINNFQNKGVEVPPVNADNAGANTGQLTDSSKLDTGGKQ